MSDFIVYCPSYKRSDICRSHLLFDPAKFFYVVREEEEHLYRKKGVNLKVIPSGAVSNISNTRNWILNNAESDFVVQVDDDISKFSWIYGRKYIDLTVEQLDHVLQNNFQLALDFGVKLWGMNILVDPIAYSINAPYNFDKPILGPFSASIALDVRYDESLPLKEDYDLFLQVMNKHGKAMRHNYLVYFCDHFKLKGGCQSYRTDEFEAEQKAALQKKWGSDIVRKNERNPDSVNMRIRL
jgi:hypothetical protein